MKIQYSLKHTTEKPVKSLKGKQLLNDKIYFDTELIKALALIVDSILKWTWNGGDIEHEFNYKTTEIFINNTKNRFAELPKGTVVTFTQNNL